MNGCDDLTSVRNAASYTGTPPIQPSKAAPGAVSNDLALSILHEHFEQLTALAITLENRLADECERVKDGGPLTEWRLAQVLSDKLSSTRVQREVACLLGRETPGQEP